MSAFNFRLGSLLLYLHKQFCCASVFGGENFFLMKACFIVSKAFVFQCESLTSLQERALHQKISGICLLFDFYASSFVVMLFFIFMLVCYVLLQLYKLLLLVLVNKSNQVEWVGGKVRIMWHGTGRSFRPETVIFDGNLSP